MRRVPRRPGSPDGGAPRSPFARGGAAAAWAYRILGRSVLLSFGGFEIRGIDFGRVEHLDEYQFLITQPLPRAIRNVRVVAMDGLRYEDVVAQADAVITKPGYGIVSECLANRVPVLYTDRGRFAEYRMPGGGSAALRGVPIHRKRRPARRQMA